MAGSTAGGQRGKRRALRAVEVINLASSSRRSSLRSRRSRAPAVDGVGMGDDVVGVAEVGFGATEEVEHHGGIINRLAGIMKTINDPLPLLTIRFNRQVPLSQSHAGLTQEDSTRCFVGLKVGGDGSPVLACHRIFHHDEVVENHGDGGVDPGTDAGVLLEPSRGVGVWRHCPVDVGQ